MRNFVPYNIRKHLRLHPVDILFVAGIIFILASLIYLRFQRKTVDVPVTLKISADEWWYQSKGPEPWYGTGIVKGLASFNTFGEKVAEISDVQNYETGGRKTIFVTLDLKADYNKTKKTYTFQYQPLQVGGALNLTFGSQNIKGLITYIGDDAPLSKMTIDVRLFYVYPWVADAFTPGIENKDSRGRTIIKVLDVTSANARTYEFYDQQGRRFAIAGEDPNLRDIVMKIEIAVKKYNDTYYFVDGTGIKLGAGIHLELPAVVAQYAEIAKIYP